MLLANTLLAHHTLSLNLFIVTLILAINWKWPSTSKQRREDADSNRSNATSLPTDPDSTSQNKIRHKRHWSKKFISDDEDEAGFAEGDPFNYSEKKISFEDEKLARHSRGESYSKPRRSLTHSRIPSLIGESIGGNTMPFRVSVDSAADLARYKANPPTPYLPPDMGDSETHQIQSQARQSNKDHPSRDSMSSNISHFSDQQRRGSLNDALRSALPPLKILNDENENVRRQSIRSSISSHSSYGSPIDRGSRMTSPLGKMRSSNPNLTSSYGVSPVDEKMANQETTENQFDPTFPRASQHHSHQLSTSSTVSSNFSSAISSSPSRPPSAPPIPASTTRYSPLSKSYQPVSDQDDMLYANSVPNSPQLQSTRSLNQNQLYSQHTAIDHSRDPMSQQGDDSTQRQNEAYSSSPLSSDAAAQIKGTSSNPFVSPQPFLTIYRSHMMLMTLICILAVDFKIFPREFAKCETYGTSLMDLGVGSFVFSLGLISALPMLKTPRNRFKPLRKQLLTSLRKSLPLLLIGGIRVLLVKGVDYHEHVSEYGLHWNFFITLGLLPMMTIVLARVFSRFFRFNSIGLGIGIGYQALLTFTALEDFVTSNDFEVRRANLLTQNKEGIFSLLGYLSIFLIGLDLGFYVLPLDPYFAYRKLSKTRQKPKTEKLMMILLSFSLIWWFCFTVLSLIGAQVSRRLANFAYVIWVVAFNTSFITAYTCVYWFWLKHPEPPKEKDRLREPKRSNLVGAEEDFDAYGSHVKSLTPVILDALNAHSFAIFLVANLLTGLVNLSIKTIHTGPIFSIAILTIYLALCIGLAVIMQRKGWRIRF